MGAGAARTGEAAVGVGHSLCVVCCCGLLLPCCKPLDQRSSLLTSGADETCVCSTSRSSSAHENARVYFCCFRPDPSHWSCSGRKRRAQSSRAANYPSRAFLCSNGRLRSFHVRPSESNPDKSFPRSNEQAAIAIDALLPTVSHTESRRPCLSLVLFILLLSPIPDTAAVGFLPFGVLAPPSTLEKALVAGLPGGTFSVATSAVLLASSAALEVLVVSALPPPRTRKAKASVATSAVTVPFRHSWETT